MQQTIISYPNGYVYEGKSTIAYENGDFYQGEAQNGAMNGMGRMYFKTGNVYQGQWQNNAMNGTGRMDFVDGIIYIGNWYNSAVNGIGSMKYQNGSIYEGDWINNEKHGNGKMTYSEGHVYEGEWKNNNRHGRGIIKYNNGDFYDGEWADDKRDGTGMITYSEGHVYNGDFLDDDRHGTGTMTYSNGDFYEGEWEYDSISGQGKMTYSNGKVYDGEWLKHDKHGKGTMTFLNGNVYEGAWIKNKITGKGTMTYSNGNVYEGEWVNPTTNCIGTMKNSNNNTSVDFYMGHELPHDFYNIVGRSGTKVTEIKTKIDQFSQNNPGSLLYLFYSLLQHIETEKQIPAEIEIPVGTVFYRTISINKAGGELDTRISGVNAYINANVSAEKNTFIKSSLGIGPEGTFCNENPLDNIVIDLPVSINNAVSILRTTEAFRVLNFNALHLLFNEQLKSGQTGDRGLIKDCCKTGDMKKFLKNNNMGICLIDSADSMDLFKTTLPIFSREMSDDELDRLDQLLPEELRRDVNNEFRKSINDIRIDDVKNGRVLPVYDLETRCMYGTLGPEFFMPPEKFKIESVSSYKNFYVQDAPHLKQRTLSYQGIKLFPNINEYDIKPGKIDGQDCHYIDPQLAARSYVYILKKLSSSTVMPFLTDCTGDETILNSIDANFDAIANEAKRLRASVEFVIPTKLLSNNNSQKHKHKNNDFKLHKPILHKMTSQSSNQTKSKNHFSQLNKSQSQPNFSQLKKSQSQPSFPTNKSYTSKKVFPISKHTNNIIKNTGKVLAHKHGGKKTYKKSKRRHNKTRRRSIAKQASKK